MVEVKETFIPGLLVIEPKVFGDDRGYFLETYNAPEFKQKGVPYDFVQDNESRSSKGVLRGLHYQIHHPQAKLVRVIEGEVFDVAVDLRKNSPTYGKSFGIHLSGENKTMLLIPRGFAHGFLVLSERATFAYKCDDVYHPNDEGGLMWNDPSLDIPWPLEGEPILSEKDRHHPTLQENPICFDL